MSNISLDSTKLVRSPIISCSRRTDIPAFLMDWLLDKMKNKRVTVANPFNPNQIAIVSLRPEDVKCWVWWSKNFNNWIKLYRLNENLFRQYKGHYFQFTINSPSELEGNLNNSLEARLKQLEWLIGEFGINAVSYRYDPIIFYKHKGSNRIKNNLSKFEYLISKISSLGLREMIFSFATIYSKVNNRMNARGYVPINPSFDKKKEILTKLISVCNTYNVKMKACCQPDLLSIEGIEQAHCIDGGKIKALIGETVTETRDTGQRKDCGCTKSKDIGGYSGIFKCKHHCSYCYASPSQK